MIPAKVEINLDEKAIQQFVQQELQKQVHQQLLFVDINRLSDLTSMSVRYLEEEILQDPRVRTHERKKNRKRWWIAQPTFTAILEIVDGW